MFLALRLLHEVVGDLDTVTTLTFPRSLAIEDQMIVSGNMVNLIALVLTQSDH